VLIGLWSLLLLSGLPEVHAQSGEGESERLARMRQVEETKDRIRTLYSQGDLQGVMRAADLLLSLDPTDNSAAFWKERAESKLQSTSSGGSSVCSDPNRVLRDPDAPRSVADVVPPTPT